MLIDVHAHLLTEGMLNRHEFWGPFMKVQGLTVGHFSLGTKQPVKAATDAEAQANILKHYLLPISSTICFLPVVP